MIDRYRKEIIPSVRLTYEAGDSQHPASPRGVRLVEMMLQHAYPAVYLSVCLFLWEAEFVLMMSGRRNKSVVLA